MRPYEEPCLLGWSLIIRVQVAEGGEGEGLQPFTCSAKWGAVKGVYTFYL